MADEGATPRELILEASRRNNTDLLQEVFTTLGASSSSKSHTQSSDAEALSPSETAIANLINTARDGTGLASLHIAAAAGSLDVLDALLDQPGVETDPLDRREGETPLHKAVQHCNEQELHLPEANGAGGPADNDDFLEANEGHAIVEMLVDAGCDPRIRNKGRIKPVDQVDPRNTLLRDFLRRAEMALDLGPDVVDDDEQSEGGSGPPSDEE